MQDDNPEKRKAHEQADKYGVAKSLYKNLTDFGYTPDELGVKDEAEFVDKLGSPVNRKKVYDAISQAGEFDLGDYESYERSLADDYTKAFAERRPQLFDQQRKVAKAADELHNAGNRITERGYSFNPEAENPSDDPSVYGQLGFAAQRGRNKEVAEAVPQYDNSELSIVQLKMQRDRLINKLNERETAVREQYNKDREEKSPFVRWVESLNRAEQHGSFFPEDVLGQDKEANAYRAAISELNNAIKTVEDTRGNTSPGFWKGIWDGLSDGMKSFLTMSYEDINKGITAYDIANKNNGVAESDAEQEFVNAMATRSNFDNLYGRNYSSWYKYGNMTGEMFPFMLEIGLSPGSLFSAGSKGAAKIVGKQTIKEIGEQGVRKYIKANGVKGAGNVLVKNLGVVADDIGKAAITNATLGAGGVAADALGRMTGGVEQTRDGKFKIEKGKDIDEAVWQAGMSNLIEVYSEMLGGHFGGIERVIGDKLSKVFSPKWLTSVLSTGKMQSVKNLYGGVGKVFEQMGISDYFGEVGEEYAGQLLRTAFNLDDAYTVDADGKRVNLLFTKDFNKDILVGMALSMGVMGAAKGGLTAASYAKYNHDVNKADARCGEVFGQQEWQGIKNTIDNTTNEDMGALFNAIANDGTMNEREKMAAADYITKSMTLRGFNLSAARTGEEQSSELAKLNTSFSRGYNAQGTDKADIQAELQFFAERARNVLGDDFDRLDNADVATAIGIANSYSGDARTAAMDYLTAKQSYNGVEQKYKDTASFTEEMIRAKYGSIAHTADGMVHAATTIGGKRVYIISGNVVAYSDGTGVDISNSDDSIIVADEEGNRSQISPKELLLLDDVQEVKPLIDLELSLNEQQSVMDRQRDFDGMVEPVSGVMYPFISPTTGELTEAELQPTEDGQMQHEDGSYIIKTATGEVVPFTSLEELQANVNEARKAKVRAKYAELQKQDEAETSEKPLEGEVVENYRVDDEVGLEVDGVSINGVVQDYIPEDDTLIIDLDRPIDGKYTIAITTDELASMAVSHNGRELERREPQQGAKDAGGGLFAAPLSEQENGNGSNEEIAQTEQHSAVSMLPHDIDGNPIYEQGEPAVAFDAITEQCEGNGEVAMSVAESMLADKVKALKAVEKAKSKGGESVAEKIAAEKERMAAIEQAKKDVEAWQAIVEAGKIRQTAQAMDSRQAAVAPEVVADGTLNGVPDVIDDTPQEARARGYRRVNGHKVERQEPVAHSTGREVEVKFSNDKTMKGRAVLIEADELQPSHQGGQRNPVHFIDEAQPKERVDNASRAALNRMAAHIRPEEITSSVTAYTGAPTVNARGEVIQGNNRSGALKAMYAQHKDQAEKYKQYLLDNAERLGLDRAEIEAMKNPVLVNMVDVSDEEAVNLGQYEAKDTESGGVERIKPKNTVQKIGTDIGAFFNTLFASNEEDLSLAELIDKNGAEVLAYLNRKGYITDTQYKSAFDSKGNLTAEAKNDLRGIVVSHIFQNGNSRLEEMFNAMPAKAQKAILATAYRDNASPEGERMMTEIQNSVRAFHALMQYDEFANARNYEAARKAVENWAKQYQYDDATGESYLPAEKFSNFALVLATMYKGRTQKFVQDSFTDMYDLIQGTRKGDLFGTPDNTPRTLAQAIKEVLNIDYNENRNGQAGNNGVGIDTQKSERGRRGSNGDVGGRKHSKGTESQTDSGGRVGGDSQGNGEVVESQSFLDVVRTLYSKGKEVASKLFQRSFFDIAQTPRFMQELGLRGDKFTIKYGVIARHISKDNSHSLSEQVWEQLPQALQNPFAISRITDRENSYRIYTTLETENGEYVVVGVDVKNAGREIEVNAISTVFGRRNNANLSKNEEVIYRSKKITPEQSSLLERPNFVQYPTGQELSDDKGTTKNEIDNEPNEKFRLRTAERQEQTERYGYTEDDYKAEDALNKKYAKELSYLDSIYDDDLEFDKKAAELDDRLPDGFTTVVRNNRCVIILHEPAVYTNLNSTRRKFKVGDTIQISYEGRYPHVTVTKVDSNGKVVSAIDAFDGRTIIENGKRRNIDDVLNEPAPQTGNGDELGEKIAQAEAEVDTDPTEKQKEAGNYKKGHVRIGEFDISIEQPKGSVRRGVDANGRTWETKMNNTYGYIRGTEGVDGDTIAQLSGSEYAMLKNNAEKNMRKYASRKKQYEADQTYIHNAKPKLKGLIKEAEQRIEDNGSYLKAVQSAFPNGRFGEISVGKQRFASVEAMEDFFKDYNKKALADMQKIKSGEITGDQRRELTIRIGDFDFVVTTDLSRKTASEGRTLFTQAERKMTYSCPELGIENVPVKQNLLRNAVEDITTNVLTGKDFSEQLEAAQRSKRHNEAELEQMLSREGKPFEYEKELKQAQAQYEEYSELMKKELEEKEAKYADMDASVETANGITSTEEDEEENNGDTLYRSDEDYTIETVNEKFNEELQQQIDGTLPQGHIYQIGMPGFILQSAGFPHLPIELSSTRLSKKASQENHIFDISEVKDLVKELNNPLAVFRYGDNAKNVIIGIEHNGKQFLVGVHFNQERNGLDISSIRGVFPKTNAKWLNWIVQGKAEYLNKERIQTLIDQQRTNLADVDYLDLDSVAKVVKDFENPTNTDDIRFRRSDRFFNGISADDLFDLLNEYSSYSFGAYELIDSLEKYYGGELISASSGAKHAIERGFVPKPGHKYSGLDGEYHHIEFQDENGDTFVEAVPFIEAKNVESDLGIKFGKEDKNRVPLTKSEEVLRDAVIDRIRRSGIEVIDDPAVGQRVLDMANGDAKEQAKKKRALETVSLSHTENNQQTVISSAEGAKVLNNLDTLAKDCEKSQKTKEKTFLGDVAKALGAKRYGSGSEYVTFETKNGKVVTIRLADYNAKVSNFDRRNELRGISIVVSAKKSAGITNDGDAHIVEYYYDAIKLRKAEGKPLAEIVRSIQQALYSGEFKDTTGLAERQEVNADNLREHRVYHGSGAEFEAFDHSHMGEGEGQQAYGWGTYVTEVEGIGEYYAKTSFLIAEEKRSSSRRATPVSMAVGAIIHQENYNLQAVSFEQRKEAAIADLETKIKIDENVLRNEKEDETMTALRKEAAERNKATLDALRAMREEQYNEERSRQGRIRHLYTVEIPEDNGNNYLDWNEPLSDSQIEAIRAYLSENYRRNKLEDFDASIAESKGAPNADEVNAWARKGENVYKTLSHLLGSGDVASKALSEMGFVGIKYPAGNLRGGRADGAKNYVVFNERDLQIVDHVRFFKGANGEAYGFTVDGKIYIDTRIANTETPIHEYAHLWAEALRNGNAKEWNNVVGLMKGTSVWEEVTKRYPELKSDDEIAEEVIALYSGRRGAERLREEMRKATEGENSVFEKAEAVNALQRVKRALEKFWKGIADFLHIHYTSATEVADRVMRDLLNEVNPINTDISARNGVGAYTDDEISYENDPWSKLAGRPLRTQFQRKEFARKERQRMVDRVNELAEKLHLDNVDIVTDASTLEGKKKRAKGFYSKSTGKITIVIPNHTSTFDAEQTLLHEAVAHYGLRQLFGEHFDTFLDNVFTNADMQVREQIVALATRNGWDFRKATEEYLATLAENTNFENLNAGWWSKIKQLFMDLLHKIGFDGFGGVALSDNELRYILWRSYQNLVSPGKYKSILGEAEDIAKQYDLKVGDYAETKEFSDKAAEKEDELMFRDIDPDNEFVVKDRAYAAHIYNQRVKGGMYQFKEAMQDSMLGLKELMRSVYEANGKKDFNIADVPTFENAYTGENALSSINEKEVEAFNRTFFQPLNVVISKLATTADERDELIEYMMAKHGLERNVYMAERDAKSKLEKSGKSEEELEKMIEKNRQKDYAGLTALTGIKDVAEAELEAERMVAEYESMHETEPIWDLLKEINDAILSKSLECGLISKETYETISSMYNYYIPLRGFDEKTADEEYAYLNERHGTFNAPIKKANGRRSKADNPLAYLQSMAESTIMQGNRNRFVKNRFLAFVRNHPSDAYSISDLWLQYDDVAGEWKPLLPTLNESDTPEEVERKLTEFNDKLMQLAEEEPEKYKRGREADNIPYRVVNNSDLHQHQVIVKRRGRNVVITINGNPRAAQALNGLTNPDNNDMRGSIGSIISLVGDVNRTLSALFTTLQPDFIVSNFLRDLIYSNSMAFVKEGADYWKRFALNYFVNAWSLKGLFAKYRKGTLDTNNRVEASFKQFLDNGGETGYRRMLDVEEHKKEIEKALKTLNKKMPFEEWRKHFANWLDEIGRSIETKARFAAFMTSRSLGRDIGRSIFDAKEISVNFNKKGAGDRFLKSQGQTLLGKSGAFVSGAGRTLFIFWNAAIQGTFGNFAKALSQHPGRSLSVASALFILGMFIQKLVSDGDDGDDDKRGSYYDLPETIRRNNFVFPGPGKSWIKVPLPIEYQAIYGMGELLGGKMFHNEPLSVAEFASQISKLTPIDIMEGQTNNKDGLDLLAPFTPSAIKPMLEVQKNRSWYGLPIYKDTPFNKNMPEWTKAYKNTNTKIVDLCAYLNEMSGGTSYEKGKVDLNPAEIEYLLRSYGGGFWTLPNQLVKLYEAGLGEDFDWRNVPLVNRFVTNGDERTKNRALNNEFFRLEEEYKQTMRLIKAYEKDKAQGDKKAVKRLQEIKKSKEYAHLAAFDDKNLYSKIKKRKKMLKEATTEEEEDKLKKELNEMKKQVVKKVRLIDAL